MYVCTCEYRSRHSLWMGLYLGVKKNIQDTPNYIINGQSVVIIIQINGNGKLELLLKLQNFPIKKRLFFRPVSLPVPLQTAGMWNIPLQEQENSLFSIFFQARFRQVLHVVCVQTGLPNPRCQCFSTGELLLKSPWCTTAQFCCWTTWLYFKARSSLRRGTIRDVASGPWTWGCGRPRPRFKCQ